MESWRRSSLIPGVQLVEIPTWFGLLYKNFGCAEPLLSWLQREKGVSVSSILQDARSWPSTDARTGHGTQAHTQKTRELPSAVSLPAAVDLEFLHVWMGKSRLDTFWTPNELFLRLFSEAVHLSSFVLVDYASVVNVVWLKRVNHQNPWASLAIREMNFYFVQRRDALLDNKLNA